MKTIRANNEFSFGDVGVDWNKCVNDKEGRKEGRRGNAYKAKERKAIEPQGEGGKLSPNQELGGEVKLQRTVRLVALN